MPWIWPISRRPAGALSIGRPGAAVAWFKLSLGSDDNQVVDFRELFRGFD